MEVRQAEERLRVAMLNSDVAALDALIDDQLIFVGPNGAASSKADDLSVHRSGAQRLTRLELDELHVELHGRTAVTSVRAHIAGSLHGHAFEGVVRYTRTWKYDARGWQVIGGAACAVTG